MSARSLQLVVAIGALLAYAPTAPAQQVAYAASALSELDSVTQAAVVRELGRARTRGLPVQPLVAKVREGQIKRAAPERIRHAVAALTTRLDSARSALGAASNAAELVAGADAIAAGVNQAALHAVRAASGERDVSAPLGALAQLVASGVPVRRATQMIVELVKRDAGPREILAFGIAVESDVGAGVPAEESALFRLRAIESGAAGGATTLSTGIGDPVTIPTSPGDARRPRRKP
ncbi:MAG TPA: hypothetical protein VKA54_10630 [Gemmatimonadaceae bacterium]|nr:hypothetical protein [Gemmatimonadaceae bacterium]